MHKTKPQLLSHQADSSCGKKKGLVTTFFPREEPACVLTFLCINYNGKYSMLHAAEHQDRRKY